MFKNLDYINFQQLKKNLSNESLKGFRVENNSTPMKTRNRPSEATVTPPVPIQVFMFVYRLFIIKITQLRCDIIYLGIHYSNF